MENKSKTNILFKKGILMKILDKLFCKHDWKVLSSNTIQGLHLTGIPEISYTGPYGYSPSDFLKDLHDRSRDRLHVLVSCNKCGKLHQKVL